MYSHRQGRAESLNDSTLCEKSSNTLLKHTWHAVQQSFKHFMEIGKHVWLCGACSFAQKPKCNVTLWFIRTAHAHREEIFEPMSLDMWATVCCISLLFSYYAKNFWGDLNAARARGGKTTWITNNTNCVVILFRSEMCYVNIRKIIQGENF